MDIVLCLRRYANGSTTDRTSVGMAREAADEIERLRVQLADAQADYLRLLREKQERLLNMKA